VILSEEADRILFVFTRWWDV